MNLVKQVNAKDVRARAIKLAGLTSYQKSSIENREIIKKVRI